VPLLAHLTDADIRRYVAGVPSAETGRHVRVCLNCAQRLGDAAQRVVRWERRGLLGRLVRIDPSQMVEELLTEVEKEQNPHAA
jgi:DNA-binding transcriptional regulator PaaX